MIANLAVEVVQIQKLYIQQQQEMKNICNHFSQQINNLHKACESLLSATGSNTKHGAQLQTDLEQLRVLVINTAVPDDAQIVNGEAAS